MEYSPNKADETREQGERTTPRKKERTYSVQVLPSNRHPFQVHFDVLRRFVTLARNGEGVPASAVEGAGVPVQAASMNVRFLKTIGLLGATERGKYVPTPEAIRFINARSVSDERAKPVLAATITNSWFADLSRTIFSTQPIMSEDQFLGELALAAQTDKAKEEPALRVILEYLVYSGLVTRDERGLSLGEGAISPTSQPKATDASSVETRLVPERTTETPGWHVLQTEDFYVKVKSDLDVVQDLVDHLATIKKKIERLKGKVAPAGPTTSKSDGLDLVSGR